MQQMALRTIMAGLTVTATVVGVGAAHAAPRPLPVDQIPATSFVVSGTLLPGPVFTRIAARSTSPGVVEFSAPTRPEMCATTYGRTVVRIAYENVGRGVRGSVTVKSCDFDYAPRTPLAAAARTGAGRILVTVNVLGAPSDPRAGQPSIPGVGTFTAP